MKGALSRMKVVYFKFGTLMHFVKRENSKRSIKIHKPDANRKTRFASGFLILQG